MPRAPCTLRRTPLASARCAALSRSAYRRSCRAPRVRPDELVEFIGIEKNAATDSNERVAQALLVCGALQPARLVFTVDRYPGCLQFGGPVEWDQLLRHVS